MQQQWDQMAESSHKQASAGALVAVRQRTGFLVDLMNADKLQEELAALLLRQECSPAGAARQLLAATSSNAQAKVDVWRRRAASGLALLELQDRAGLLEQMAEGEEKELEA